MIFVYTSTDTDLCLALPLQSLYLKSSQKKKLVKVSWNYH